VSGPTIDLNADLGEGFGRWRLTDDEGLLHTVTSANVACGFHAGDPLTMRRVCARAAELGVSVGAQVSYPDLVGFGRRRLDVAAEELAADVLYQIGALEGACRAAGSRVRYVKPHGALYHAAGGDEGTASAILDAVAAYDRTLPVLGLPGSVLLRLATERGLTAVTEAFADRGYTPDGRLVPRDRPGALLTDPDAVVTQALRLAGGPGAARSLCVHGDTPGAVALAGRVRAALLAAGIALTPFA